MRPRLLRQGQEEVTVTGAHRVLLTRRGQSLEPVLAQRLEQPVADGALTVLDADQRLVDQRAELIEHPLGLHTVARAYVLCRLEREAAREHAQAAQQQPLAGGEQVVAPVQRRAQGLLTLARRARPPDQQAEAIG